MASRFAYVAAIGVRMAAAICASLGSFASAVADNGPSIAGWEHYGRTPAGTRYVPYEQISKENVGRLQVAWTLRTGEISDTGSEDQNTPLLIGDTLYSCTPRNVVIAIDAETGKERWRFDPKADNPVYWRRCRGLGFYKSLASVFAAGCKERILVGTIDARLMAVDAKTGKPCEQFGEKGTVNLLEGLGEAPPGFYFVTSPPTVARGKVIVGGWVLDNVSTDEPSGVIRAFDAETGKFAWAWDMGRPDDHGMPPPGQSFTPGTPNSWSIQSYDDALGLVYVPTGNATPDFWGGNRSKVADKYASSVVALDVETGAARWSFQTTHHDLWDYDVPAQPVLVDLPAGYSTTTPALVQVTKRGEIFLLDRRNGKPLADVEERPVPQGTVVGDWTAPTQPFSVGMPSFSGELVEADMWGITPLDQLFCRIKYRSLRYEGQMTPPSLRGSLQYPGDGGGMNWGSTAVDTERMIMIVNDMRLANEVTLVPREEADARELGRTHEGFSPQYGTPFGVVNDLFASPLGLPCQRPPYGIMAAIDLKTRKVLWSKPMGTGEAMIGLPLPNGMPTKHRCSTLRDRRYSRFTRMRCVAVDICASTQRLRRQAKGAQESPPHPFWVSKACACRNGFDRNAGALHPFARDFESKTFDGLGRCQANRPGKGPRKVARTHGHPVGQQLYRQWCCEIRAKPSE